MVLTDFNTGFKSCSHCVVRSSQKCAKIQLKLYLGYNQKEIYLEKCPQKEEAEFPSHLHSPFRSLNGSKCSHTRVFTCASVCVSLCVHVCVHCVSAGLRGCAMRVCRGVCACVCDSIFGLTHRRP